MTKHTKGNEIVKTAHRFVPMVKTFALCKLQLEFNNAAGFSVNGNYVLEIV